MSATDMNNEPNPLRVNVSFTLDIDPQVWLDYEAATAENVIRIPMEVARYAEGVIRDLFSDQGWVSAVGSVSGGQVL